MTTLLLKMKPDEHEYKVMGLAPYAKNKYSTNVYEKVYKNLLKVNGIRILHKNRPKDLYKYLIESTQEKDLIILQVEFKFLLKN